MNIKVTCPNCERRFQAPEAYAGKHGPCPKCGKPLTVPRQTAAVARQASAMATISQDEPLVVASVCATPLVIAQVKPAATLSNKRRRFKRWPLTVLVGVTACLFAAVLIVAFSSDDPDVAPASTGSGVKAPSGATRDLLPEAIEISIAQLVEEYKNELQADKKYKNQMLRLTGTLTGNFLSNYLVDSENPDDRVTLGSQLIEHHGGMFPEPVGKWHGATITIRGECMGRGNGGLRMMKYVIETPRDEIERQVAEIKQVKADAALKVAQTELVEMEKNLLAIPFVTPDENTGQFTDEALEILAEHHVVRVTGSIERIADNDATFEIKLSACNGICQVNASISKLRKTDVEQMQIGQSVTLQGEISHTWRPRQQQNIHMYHTVIVQ